MSVVPTHTHVAVKGAIRKVSIKHVIFKYRFPVKIQNIFVLFSFFVIKFSK